LSLTASVDNNGRFRKGLRVPLGCLNSLMQATFSRRFATSSRDNNAVLDERRRKESQILMAEGLDSQGILGRVA
jgi:hypothetical protein